MVNWLVVEPSPSEKYGFVKLEGWHPIYCGKKHVPNHQPDDLLNVFLASQRVWPEACDLHSHVVNQKMKKKQFKQKRENCPNFTHGQWIGLRENLQETMVFTIKYRGFL